MESSDLLFDNPVPAFVATARQIATRNRDIVRQSFPVHLARHEALLDGLYAYVSAHVWTFRLSRQRPTPIQQLGFSASHKNLIALLGILENVQAGLLGPVRPLFRQVLEAQLLAKFAAVRNDVDLADRWSRQEPLSVPRVVLSNMYGSQAQVLRTMWQSSHVFVHSSTGSQQVSLDAEQNIDRIAHDLTVMGMLLHTQVHLTTQHTFSRAERYYAATYDKKNTIPALRRQMRANLSIDLGEHGPDVRAFIRTFRSTWRGKDGAPFVKNGGGAIFPAPQT
jgi:hypothetical protein